MLIGASSSTVVLSYRLRLIWCMSQNRLLDIYSRYLQTTNIFVMAVLVNMKTLSQIKLPQPTFLFPITFYFYVWRKQSRYSIPAQQSCALYAQCEMPSLFKVRYIHNEQSYIFAFLISTETSYLLSSDLSAMYNFGQT